jgi:hypothetical protein
MPNLIDKNFHYAVVGASTHANKYGYIVFSDLLGAGYTVYPINPKGGELLGQKVYPTLGDCLGEGHTVDVAVMVTQPEIVLTVLERVKELGIPKVWFQPGSESKAALDYCKANGLESSANACVMLTRPKQ